ncbi:MAG: UDP-N-acetylmuramoylalanyl-D-glutamyl-2,6-diaminopimelate--D-alanyl-D-alanine ligase [Alphaproteobacteria bacterium]|nr:UDP-N-acetylmuramoylalanyl-D-glutamyl-2,6-diaminopimelate--D-alanyl-D-alanine ligase [Alphaproteobacteria bacterium]
MTTALWTAADMISATGGKTTADFTATGISIDTRTLKKGEVYIALQGVEKDGHDYVDAAFKAGAAAAIVREGFKATGPLLHVADTLKALEALGIAGRNRATGKIIAVTGSAGKTGTKDMLAAMLHAYASKKSYNNHWGVPLSLANLPPDAPYAIFEMGMNHAGELETLTKMVRPHIALITSIEPVHIEHFPNIEAIADAKAEVFLGMDENGIAILPHDNPHFERLKKHAEAAGLSTILGFGEEEDADAHMTHCALHADSSKVSGNIRGQGISFKLSIPGHHIAMNAIAALLTIDAAGGDISRATQALGNLNPPEGRGNRIPIIIEDGAPPLMIVDDSYNANPASMRAAFSVLEMVTPQGEGRRIAVLGDMLELGPKGPQIHAELANPLLHAKADILFCCGAQMDALYNVLPEDWRGAHAKDSTALAPLVAEFVKPGDVVLVKGSLGSKMGYIVHALEQLAVKDARHAV